MKSKIIVFYYLQGIAFQVPNLFVMGGKRKKDWQLFQKLNFLHFILALFPIITLTPIHPPPCLQGLDFLSCRFRKLVIFCVNCADLVKNIILFGVTWDKGLTWVQEANCFASNTGWHKAPVYSV